MGVFDKSMPPPVLALVRALLTAAVCLGLSVPAVHAEEDDLRSLELYNGASVETVSSGRSPRPASQTAENITVVTASEIEAMNAHTLADILFTATGVQFESLRTPGTSVNWEIQGSRVNHILVLIDNVPLNNLAENFPDISSVPVQMIERVEIVKGAASSSWGSALGGVVNVITKSPQTDRTFGGLASASLGKKATADGRGEVTGTLNRFGYYLTGGKLRSDGLQQNNMADLNNFYGKLRYDLPQRGSLTLTTGLVGGSSGQLALAPADVNQDMSLLISTLSIQYPLTESLSIDAAARLKRTDMEIDTLSQVGNTLLKVVRDEESDSGASLKASWHDELQRLVAGLDYDHVKAHLSLPQKQADVLNNSADRVGVFLNDTVTLGGFAVTPSVRFDHTGSAGDLFSPSFGVTYALTENSVLRGYTARGYSLISLNRDDSTEKVWTSQVGFESAEIPFLWLKGTLFRNDTWNVTAGPDQSGVFFKQRQLKQGYELEGRTLPCLDTSLSLGYTFVDAKDGDSGAILPGIARHTLNLSVKYEDSRHLRALLTAHYIDWHTADGGQNGKYAAVICDLHLSKKFEYSDSRSVELFVSVRNIFNGEQELISAYKNPGRWGEAGVRCAF